MNDKPHISVVTPVYEAEGCLHELYRRLVSSLEPLSPDFEIIMVEDCGRDRSWDIIVELAKKDPRVKGIHFSRNFGQHYAISAGLDYAKGDWVVVMDCDLQDQPEEIRKMYNKAQEGYDVVFGRRSQRQDHFIRTFTSGLFIKIFNYFTEENFDNSVANFSISRQAVIENFRKLREHNRSFQLFIFWIGFKKAFVDIEHAERFAGKTSYNFRKLLHFALDNIIAHSNRPLRLSIKFGFIMTLLSFLYAVYLIIKYFVFKITVPGWTSLIVSLYFIAGLLFMNLGVLGLYIGKTFDEVKNRPLYIIRETMNLKE